MAEKRHLTPEEREKRAKRRARRKIKRNAIYSFLALLLINIIFFFIVKSFGVLPTWALVIVGLLLLIFLAIAGYFSILPAFKNSVKIIQTGINIALCIVMVLGCIALPSWKGKLSKAFVSVPDEGEMNINVYVLADSSYQDVEDIAGQVIGVQTKLDTEYQNYAIKVVNKEIEGADIRTTGYEGIYEAVEALYAGEVEAIMLNESYAKIIEGNDDYSDFTSKVKNLYTCTQKVTLTTGANAKSDLTEEPFIIAVTGVDQWNYSEIAATAKPRSDVNMILAVNPKTHQVLMVTIPRDSYVALGGNSSKMDKLTHATTIGMDCWIQSLDNLLGIDVNYYLRVNFSSIVDIVNAIGGIDVDNPYYFETKAVVVEHNYTNNSDKTEFTVFEKGPIHLDGAHALGYCRERYYIKADGGQIGDMGRNQHQAIVLKACIKKVCSVSMITKISSLLDAVEGKFTTNLEMNDIYALAKMQLEDMSDWDVQTYALTGSSAMASSYVGGTTLSMVMLYENSITKASEYINSIMNGNIVSTGN